MTLVVDIGCPNCGRKLPVRKAGIGQYHCSNCGAEFTQKDVLSR